MEIAQTKDDLETAFKTIIKENPYHFDQDYLNKLKLNVLSFQIKERDADVKYVIENFNYHESYESDLLSRNDAKILAKHIYNIIVLDSDLQRKDPHICQLIDQATAEAEKQWDKQKKPWLYKLFRIEDRPLGSCYWIWGEMKRILKERHGIDWKAPSERNPAVKYD